jgi:hypothetical protein
VRRIVVRFQIVAVLLAVASCAEAGPQTLNRPALRATNPRTLAVARSPTPRFVAKTYSGAVTEGLFGLGGLAVAESTFRTNGQAITNGGATYDPAVAISERLAEGLAKRFSLRVLPVDGSLTQATTPRELAARYRDADLVLDVRTSNWGFHPTAVEHYGATYDGTLRLIDARTGSVLAEGLCSQHPVPTSDGPTYDELLANDAALLKRMLGSIAESCSDDYRKRILGLYQ